MTFFLPSYIISWSSSCLPLWRCKSHHHYIKYAEIFPPSSCPISFSSHLIKITILRSSWSCRSSGLNPRKSLCVSHWFHWKSLHYGRLARRGQPWDFCKDSIPLFMVPPCCPVFRALFWYLLKPCHFEGSLFWWTILLLPFFFFFVTSVVYPSFGARD